MKKLNKSLNGGQVIRGDRKRRTKEDEEEVEK